MGAGQVDLYVFEEASDLDFQGISIVPGDFGESFDHDPRDAVIGANNLIMSDDESDVGEDDEHVFLPLVLLHYALLVSSLCFLFLHRLELRADQFDRRVDVSEGFSLSEFPAYFEEYLKTSLTFLKMRSSFSVKPMNLNSNLT